ncbi:MAG: SpoIIE family protein phosphatase [Lachnospiraceae bacterium]|nr:SpoIIE family protein phosphatase [Lachnospiraceae bacterium]
MKRVPIRKKIRRLLIRIAMFSMLAISIAALILMLRIRHRSEGYILANIEENVMDSLEYVAILTEEMADGYATTIKESVNYIENLYKDKDNHRRIDYGRHTHVGEGDFCYNRYYATTEFINDNTIDEVQLLNNVIEMWKPILMYDDVNISSLYLATEEGFLISLDRDHLSFSGRDEDTYFNFFNREWYTETKERDSLIFTKVSQDYFDRGLTLTCAMPFYKDSSFAGVVALDILVHDIQKNIQNVDVSVDSIAFAVDSDGDIIASPSVKDDQTSFENIKDEGTDTSIIADKILSGNPGIELLGDNYYVYAPINNVKWVICVKLPKAIIAESINRIDRNIIRMMGIFVLVAAIMLIIVYKISIAFSNRLTVPIEKLKDDVEIISKGKLDYKAEVVGNDEISDLANSFNDMTTDLKNYISNLTELTAERERNSAELNVATKIQVGMLPSDFPAFPDDKRFDIYATMNPAKEVGGDFYDFFMIDDKHIAIVVADVSGKGVPAALFMAIGKTLIRDHTFIKNDLADVFYTVNNILCDENKENLFITAFEAVINLETGRMVYVNAGHELPYIYKKGKVWEAYNIKPGFVLGGMNDMKFTVGEIILEKGDRIFEYTDGVTEATNAHNELYGMDRLKVSLDNHSEESVKDLLPAIKKDIDEFVDTAPQFDDITMLCFEYRGNV